MFLHIKNYFEITGELDYKDVFFKDKNPEGWGDEFDKDWFLVPYPLVTYSMFVAFVIVVTFLAFNVLVGLTVDDIRKFRRDACLRKIKRRLEYIRRQRKFGSFFFKKSKREFNQITRNTNFGKKIFNEIEKRLMKIRESRKMKDESKNMQAVLEHQQSEIKELKEVLEHLVHKNLETKLEKQKSQIKDLKDSINANQEAQMKKLKEILMKLDKS